MNTVTVSKTDFIKFNVSPTFKALAAKKAKKHGMTLSELGRMLFGSFVVEKTYSDTMSPQFLAMEKKAKKEYEAGKGIRIHTKEELESFLKSLS